LANGRFLLGGFFYRESTPTPSDVRCELQGRKFTAIHHRCFLVRAEIICRQMGANDKVVKVVELLLVVPATNATSECLFSILRRINQYLRSTMTKARLNHLMICSIYKERMDKLDLRKVANYFITDHDNRMDMFGLFK